MIKGMHNIKLLGLDVDGVLTDGKLYYNEHGEQLKVFNVKDGQGIVQLRQAGIHIAIISSRQSNMVIKRAEELGIKHIYQKQASKTLAAQNLLSELKLDFSNMAFMGDDINDIPLLQKVGLPMTTADAHWQVRNCCAWQSQFSGGNGAVRQACDELLGLKDES